MTDLSLSLSLSLPSFPPLLFPLSLLPSSLPASLTLSLFLSLSQEDAMEVEVAPLRSARSASGTPTSSGHMIRPKAKRTYTGDLAPSYSSSQPSSSLPSPSTPHDPHSSLLTLLSQIFRVSIMVGIMHHIILCNTSNIIIITIFPRIVRTLRIDHALE